MPIRMLTPEERTQRGVQLAGLVRDRIDLVDAHKEASAEHRETLKGLDKRIAQLSFDVQNGFEVVTEQQELFADVACGERVVVRDAAEAYPSFVEEAD